MYISLGKIKQSPTGMFRDRALQRKNQPQWQELIENMGGGEVLVVKNYVFVTVPIELVMNDKTWQRVTKQWQDIGFQGEDPKTDFRGMGMLGLHNLM